MSSYLRQYCGAHVSRIVSSPSCSVASGGRLSSLLPSAQRQMLRYAASSAANSVNLNVRQASAEWEQRNRKLGRPMSPHLSIYKYQLTAVLSITHRATGLAMHAGLLGLAAMAVSMPGSFGEMLQTMSGSPVGWLALVSVKAAAAWMFFYHAANGVRHLFWDIGHGFSLPALYRSGYAVLAFATVATVAIMFL